MRFAQPAAFCIFLASVGSARAEPVVDRTPDFAIDVLPILTKAGCNNGSCHGAAAGRGGLALSLYGSRPERDHNALARALRSRRINVVKPGNSLMLLKGTNELPHGGGFRIDPETSEYSILKKWIAAGAPAPGKPRLKSITVSLKTSGRVPLKKPVAVRVVATHSDGSTRDVTLLSRFIPDDADGLDVGEGSVTALRTGRHVFVVRYLNLVSPAEILIPVAKSPKSEPLPRAGFIDDFVNFRLKKLGLTPAGRCSDSTFVRRAYLDVTGRLPTPKQAQRFVGARHKDKRRRLIDHLLASEEFNTFWAWRLSRLLRVQRRPQADAAARVYHAWFKSQLKQKTGWDRMVATLLTAKGDTRTAGPPNFWLTAGDPRLQTEFVSEALLGIRLRCANCHDHPLDQWTQEDYHGLAAVFARVRTGATVRVASSGEVIHPGTGEPAAPQIPGAGKIKVEPTRDLRGDLAGWTIAKENPLFARAFVNRLWKWTMGRGLVEPVDDMSTTNLPTHPKLLAKLADDFRQNRFDLRHTLRTILLSEAWQRSTRRTGSPVAGRFLAHRFPKPLEPEVLIDAICDVTGVAESKMRSIERYAGNLPSDALAKLGRCVDKRGCADIETDAAAGLSTALYFVNGPLINKKVAGPSGRLSQRLAGKTTNAEIIGEFYRRAYSRNPTKKELAFWLRQTSRAAIRKAVLQDFLWSLLVSRDFQHNQ